MPHGENFPVEHARDRFGDGAGYYKGRTPYSGAFFRKLAIELNLDKTTAILDLACGRGELALGLSPYAGSIVGTDQSKAMLEIASKSNWRNVAFRQHDLNESPFASETKFDVVTIGRAIPYIKPPMLKQTLSRSLRRGGAVVICGAGMGADTVWFGAYQKIRRRFTERKERLDFRGIQKMTSINFRLAKAVNDTVSASYDIEDILNHALSYHTQTKMILENKHEFLLALENELAPFRGNNGTYSASEHSWGLIFQERAV